MHSAVDPTDDLAAVLAARLAATGLLDGLRAQVRAAAVAALRGCGGGATPDAPSPHPPSLADALVAQHLAATGRGLTASVFESEAGGPWEGGGQQPGAASLASKIGLGGGGHAAVDASGSVLEALCASVESLRGDRSAAAAAQAALDAVRRELGGGGVDGGGPAGVRAPHAAGAAELAAALDLSGDDACLLSLSSSSSSSGEE